MAGRLPAYYRHRGLADTAQLGQKCDQVRIGLTVHRRGGNPDLEGLTMHPADFILAGAGLDVDIEEQVVTLPGIPTGHA